MNALIALGIEVEIAQKAATKALNEVGNEDLPTIMKVAINLAEQLNEPKPKTSKKRTGTLLQIVEQAKKNKKSNYELLKEAGYIKSPLDEFAM